MKIPKKIFKKGDIVRIYGDISYKRWYKTDSYKVIGFSFHFRPKSSKTLESIEMHESRLHELETLEGDFHNWIVRVVSLKTGKYNTYGDCHLTIDKRKTRETKLKTLID